MQNNNSEEYQQDSIRVSLTINNFSGSVHEMTQKIGLQPDTAIEKGQRRNDKGPVLTESFWEVKSGLPTHTLIDQQIEHLLQKLSSHKVAIHEVSKQALVRISVGATYYHYNPEIELSPEILTGIAELGATLWQDVYCFTKDYLAEEFQREQFKKTLLNSSAVKHLGITSQNEIESIVNVLHLIESNSLPIVEDLFPERADDSKPDDEDLVDGLIKARSVINQIVDTSRQSPFLTPQ